MALVLVLIFTASLMVIGTALIAYSVNEKIISNYDILGINLYYIAESGAEAGIALLKKDFYYNGSIDGSVGEGTYQVTFKTIDSTNRDIVAVGKISEYRRTITVSMELQDYDGEEKVVVKQWLNPYPAE